jgi:hypothetical protein
MFMFSNRFIIYGEGLLAQAQPYYAWRGIVIPTPNPQAGGPPLVVCPRQLIQCIRS